MKKCSLSICTGDKDKQPCLFKIAKPLYAYSHDQRVGPTFGAGFDTKLKRAASYDNNCKHSPTTFDKKLHGNILCGGKEYSTTNVSYPFDLVSVTAFEIDILYYD